MGMSDWIVRLQGLPEYEKGYNNPGVKCPHPIGTDQCHAYELGQQDWELDNRPRTEPDE